MQLHCFLVLALLSHIISRILRFEQRIFSFNTVNLFGSNIVQIFQSVFWVKNNCLRTYLEIILILLFLLFLLFIYWPGRYSLGPGRQFQQINWPGKPPGHISPGHLDRVFQFTFICCKHVQCAVPHVENLIKVCFLLKKHERNEYMSLNNILWKNKAIENLVNKKNIYISSNAVIII